MNKNFELFRKVTTQEKYRNEFLSRYFYPDEFGFSLEKLADRYGFESVDDLHESIDFYGLWVQIGTCAFCDNPVYRARRDSMAYIRNEFGEELHPHCYRKFRVEEDKRIRAYLEELETKKQGAKSVFDSKKEEAVYKKLKKIYPDSLVLPNHAISSFVDYSIVEERLTAQEKDYYFKSRVDFLLTNPKTLFPELAIEVQSFYHDDEKIKQKDEMKAKILELAGVPLKLVHKIGDLHE